VKGHYVTVGSSDRYVLIDKLNASKKYQKGSGNIEGLFGIPHFYFRNTFFDVSQQKGNDYFAIVQRMDTLNKLDPADAEWGKPSYTDLEEYITLRWGSIANGLLKSIRDNNEFGMALMDIEHYGSGEPRAKFMIRGSAAVNSNISSFQLDKEHDPIYRHFHVNEPDGPFGTPEMEGRDTLEFHLLNQGETGYRLFENSGNYTDTDQTDRWGKDGGRVYNRWDGGRGEYFKDSLDNVISFLGLNNNVQYPNTNYAFYLDTAFIYRGTGWIKPQYMFVVDVFNPVEEEAAVECDGTLSSKPYLNNGTYKIGRYLFNAAQYAHVHGVKATPKNARKTFVENFNRVQKIITTEIRKPYPLGDSYTLSGNTEWERLAFTWAIHKGDSLYILKGAEPAYGGNPDTDRKAIFDQLVADYGGGTGNNRWIDFAKLIDECEVDTIATWPIIVPKRGDLSIAALGDLKTVKQWNYKIPTGKKIGLHAIIDLADNTHKDWVFSFRYIEGGASDFVIESETTDRDIFEGAMIRPGYGGWVKVENGVPVITRSDLKDNMGQASGSVFNVKQLQNPVGNEEVSAQASGIKVIGIKVAVSILNAGGKKVIISNMLGQTLANTTLSSDNAPIAVPAGVVVVAVEGESAAKVLVK